MGDLKKNIYLIELTQIVEMQDQRGDSRIAPTIYTGNA